MKGFIEVTTESNTKRYVNTSYIVYVLPGNTGTAELHMQHGAVLSALRLMDQYTDVINRINSAQH